jgi:hypothetical protein
MKDNHFTKGNQNKSPRQNSKKQEHLNTKEIEELMGIHRDTYKRVHGAVRRK